jgi:hypothetical protein
MSRKTSLATNGTLIRECFFDPRIQNILKRRQKVPLWLKKPSQPETVKSLAQAGMVVDHYLDRANKCLAWPIFVYDRVYDWVTADRCETDDFSWMFTKDPQLVTSLLCSMEKYHRTPRRRWDKDRVLRALSGVLAPEFGTRMELLGRVSVEELEDLPPLQSMAVFIDFKDMAMKIEEDFPQIRRVRNPGKGKPLTANHLKKDHEKLTVRYSHILKSWEGHIQACREVYLRQNKNKGDETNDFYSQFWHIDFRTELEDGLSYG